MKREKLIERYKDAVLEMFNKAKNAAGVQMSFESYEELVNSCKLAAEQHGKKTVILPFMAFYLDEKTQDEIIAKATVGLRYYYRWPGKIPIGDDNKFNAYLEDLKQYENDKKNLSKWFRKKRMNEIVSKYNLKLRSKEAEDLAFSIWNIAPNCRKDTYLTYINAYKDYKSNKDVPKDLKEEIEALDYLIQQYQCKHV